MTNDEMETRIERLETRVIALTVMTQCVLPATVPELRPQVLRQFGQYCSATERELAESDADPHAAKFHLALLAEMYTTLEGTMKLIAEHDQRRAGLS